MKKLLGKETIQKNLSDILSDESRYSLGTPIAVYFPQTVNDVVEIAFKSAQESIPLTIIGGQTGLTGGSVPVDGCIAVCFSDMNRILRVEAARGDFTLTCQSGATLQDIARFLEAPQAWPYPVEGAALLAPGAWFYPPDPTEMTAHLGGTVATNASGARSYHFGSTRAHIEALSLVFAGGDAITLRREEHPAQKGVFTATTDQGRSLSVTSPVYQSPDIKNASGYYSKKGMDLMDLFIGSEGTLALFTEITVRLVKTPKFAAGLSFFPGLGEAFAFAEFLREEPDVAAIEYFDDSALAFVRKHALGSERQIPAYPSGKRCGVYWECLESPLSVFEDRLDKWEIALTASGSSFEDTWSGFDKKEMELLKHLRHAAPESVNTSLAAYKRDFPEIRKLSTDAAFPRERFKAAIDEYLARARSAGLEYALFGHLGDCHLHMNLLPHTAEEFKTALKVYEGLMELVLASKGTISAEHGIGKIKRKYLAEMFGESALSEMMRVKTDLDPKWLLNPGNLFTR
jgi:D-lactate dehydrogenase (cytochrome)